MEKVAIIILTFNSGKYLHETIKSCKNQTYKNIDIIIVDDCSTDGTIDYLKSLSDINVFYRSENLGISKNINFAVSKTNSRYLVFLGHDDLLAPTHVEKMVEHIETDSDDIALVHCNSIKIDAKGYELGYIFKNDNQIKKTNKPLFYLAINNFLFQGGGIYDRKKFLEVNGWDERFKLYGEWLVYIKIAQKWKISYNTTTHYYYRIHSGSTMKKIETEQKKEVKLYYDLCRNLAFSSLDKNERNLKLKINIFYAKFKYYIKSRIFFSLNFLNNLKD
jgi:glycosyltransferase involved in cell wall biosynthesis